jgi:orotate phosphoribosyltransferase
MLCRDEEILTIFRETGVLKEGHFLLTSGRHSARYLQCAQALKHPDIAAKLCRLLTEELEEKELDLCIGPAMGGIIVAYEMARSLGVPALFAEREGGAMTLRRGFAVKPGEKVLVVEDVITTGGSVREVMEVVQNSGGLVTEVAVLVDRSGGSAVFDVPLRSLLTLAVESYAPAECPLCRQGLPLVKPGSRK